MLILLSPAKTLDYDTPRTTDTHTLPIFPKQATELIKLLKKFSTAQIASLMHISDALAELNAARYRAWSSSFTFENAKQALLAFNGDVYEGLAASTLNATQLDYLQSHLRILSGLYGVLRPLDLMQPYRLEMGTKLANPHGKDLYAFWGDSVTEALNKDEPSILINLASDEYFKVVKPKQLQALVITPVFEDWSKGQFKVISFYAKRARGLMARYAAMKKIVNPEKLKKFNLDGYAFELKASDAQNWVFRRKLNKD